jgi:23S rRNA (cytosine1962-C5)-methyltransferase
VAGPRTVTLRKNLGRSIASGHPWLYADAIEARPGTPTGSLVEVVERRGRPLAKGLYDAESPIAVRFWPPPREARLDAALVARRIEQAWALRRACIDLEATDAIRLLHGEGDRMPGVVCDLFGDTAVIRLDTESVRRFLPVIVASLRRALPHVTRVIERTADKHAEERATVLEGPPLDGPILVREAGMVLEADPLRGHKTGYYVDQRDNRRRVREIAAGKRVLNLFAYTGGFSVAAGLGGAAHVTTVDIAAPALDAARRNLAHNGLDPAAHALVAADAFDWLEASQDSWDLVVLDPPSMAPSAAALERALAAYRRVNELALRRVAKGGLLLTASCSSHVSEAHLVEVVRDAARAANRPTRILEHRGAGPDHPVLPAFPEGRYLSALLVFVE